MENFFAIGLRATFGPCSEAELAFGNPCAGRAISTPWKECFHTVENLFFSLSSAQKGWYIRALIP